MGASASGPSMTSRPPAWKPTPPPALAARAGRRPTSCGPSDTPSAPRSERCSALKWSFSVASTMPREGLQPTPHRTKATRQGNATVCVEPSNGSAISPTRGGEYTYRFESKKWQTLGRGHKYNRARYYDPSIGKWTSTDPMGFEAGDTNLYRYVGNGPTNSTDAIG